jgi:predicted transcriptional regulator of viral defense system
MPHLPQVARGIRGQLAAVRAIAGEQAAIVSRAQLLAAGVSANAIDRAVRAGRLSRVHRGIYAVVAPELLTEEGHLVAALLAAGDGAVLSHGTAAWRWRIIAAPPSMITLATPRRHVAVAGLEVFASARLRPGDCTHNGRFPTTTVARTLLDLATRYRDHALLKALAEAEFQHDLRPADIERTLRRGHPGSANLRAALRTMRPVTAR